jgi:hypothetical protein
LPAKRERNAAKTVMGAHRFAALIAAVMPPTAAAADP